MIVEWSEVAPAILRRDLAHSSLLQRFMASSSEQSSKSRSKGSVAKPSPARRSATRKDPKGGLTAAGRRYFAEKEGAHLRPGVTGPADTPQKMKRKGSFLRRHFAHLRGPLLDEQGKPTRLALSAHAWGEPVPKTKAAAARLAAKGTRLLERYARSQAPSKRASRGRS